MSVQISSEQIDLRKQAQQKIRDAAESAQFTQALAKPTHFGCAQNNSCGDDIRVELEVAAGKILNLKGEIRGCLVTKASWTILAREIKEMSIDSAKELLANYQTVLSMASSSEDTLNSKGLCIEIPSLLMPFRRPSPRKDCALLPSIALLQALAVL